ncbi:MAG: hypothetical protein IJC70_01305 [Firmicutes bacterium]|nr:hypothetical protein [Bacillota bacterium]
MKKLLFVLMALLLMLAACGDDTDGFSRADFRGTVTEVVAEHYENDFLCIVLIDDEVSGAPRLIEISTETAGYQKLQPGDKISGEAVWHPAESALAASLQEFIYPAVSLLLQK